MKKCLFIMLFSVSSLLMMAQQTVYVAFTPGDRGAGVRYDYKWLYAAVTKGAYYFNSCNNYIKNHYKCAVGVIYNDVVTVGLTYHQYRNRQVEAVKINRSALLPLSFELGVVQRFKWVSVGFTIDVLKWEGCVCLGFNFKR